MSLSTLASLSATTPLSRSGRAARPSDLGFRSAHLKFFFGRIGGSRSRRLSPGTLSVKCVASDREVKSDGPVSADVAGEGISGALPTYDSQSIASSIKYHAEFTPSFSPERFELPKAYVATAESVRDALIINWNATYDYYDKMNGRALLNAIGNLELTGTYADALKRLGHNLESVARQEPDAALGNGGLGRLASCFLDSLATLNYPAWGYGLRYKHGLFRQTITKDGQEEVAESWLEMGNPWEIVRHDISYPVKFYGKVVLGSDGKKHWIGGENIMAVAYDVPIPGYKTKSTINLRLWSTKVPAQDFDLHAFNSGDHAKAYEAQANAEKICYILYPGDDSVEGKILRLKQQYTLCSASLQDIIARFERRSGSSVNWEEFPNKVAVQMNDTHPTLCIPELMRVLVDLKGLSWEEAWNITQRTVAYTNHTVLPEALEKWSLELMQKLLPRHVEIIEKIDEEFIQKIVSEYGEADLEILQQKLTEMRILDNFDYPASVVELFKSKYEAIVKAKQEELKKQKEELKKQKALLKAKAAKEKVLVKSVEIPAEATDAAKVAETAKATEAVEASEVAEDAEKEISEPDPDEEEEDLAAEEPPSFKPDPKLPKMLWPEKFQNKTNGVTPRRWIRFCNPDLSDIITKWTGSEDWVLNTEKLAELRKFADNEDLQTEWKIAKRKNKMKVVSLIQERTGYVVSPDAMFDIQVKRIHEYKRQLLNILGIVYRYKKMKEMTAEERKTAFVPRVCIFGGKAFATYVQAKRIVKFITDVGATVNHDPDIGDLLKVVFVPDYNVSVAELLIPASELSQHISTAGMEASGTSNMKFSMNGCILIGTLDGANVEIREEVGEENFFLFGAQAHEIAGLRKERAEGKFVPDPRFEEVKKFVRSKVFGNQSYDELLGSLEGNEGYGRGDYFLVGKDFPEYIECQEKVDEAYRDQKAISFLIENFKLTAYHDILQTSINEVHVDKWFMLNFARLTATAAVLLSRSFFFLVSTSSSAAAAAFFFFDFTAAAFNLGWL
ncbi:hypothetical protein QJS10_CPB17g01986 [Acorus calamus]|uniref:Alpha-1,4 glucan phosphorylase n=1 Tax=Acorus calamus TaxID=4465 RepID=A0AAV9CVL3_ACOCL|nr:hypothetical protein QJS10_CPB17g01986 [Acorus calamus]